MFQKGANQGFLSTARSLIKMEHLLRWLGASWGGGLLGCNWQSTKEEPTSSVAGGPARLAWACWDLLSGLGQHRATVW